MRALAIQLVRHTRRRTKLGGRAHVDIGDLKLTRGIACPHVWQGCIKGEHIVATVHGDDITIGVERSVVEFFIKTISRKYEIKKQVIGEDADLENSGRILNRAIEWGRDGITVEADQRHVREILKDLELERANSSATPCPCAVERKNEGNARSDESEGEQGQTQTKHKRDGMCDGDGTNRPQMAGDDANDRQAFTGGGHHEVQNICGTHQ